MLNNVLIALSQDVLTFLKGHKDFFEKSKKDRLELLQKSGLFPQTICDHLAEFEEDHVIAGVREFVEYVAGYEDGLKLKSRLAKAFAEFCINEVPGDHQLKGVFGEHLEVFYASAVEKEVVEHVQSFVSRVFDTSYIVIQSPVALGDDLEAAIREELKEKYPHSIPAFSVNKKLIGGLRIFIDGKTEDHSWITQINKLTSIINT